MPSFSFINYIESSRDSVCSVELKISVHRHFISTDGRMDRGDESSLSINKNNWLDWGRGGGGKMIISYLLKKMGLQIASVKHSWVCQSKLRITLIFTHECCICTNLRIIFLNYYKMFQKLKYTPIEGCKQQKYSQQNFFLSDKEIIYRWTEY